MKYTFAYRTSDGVRHEERIDADSREEVFETLRLRGIRAIKVVAADGSKANGEVRGIRKRVVMLIALVVAAVAAFVTFKVATRHAAHVAASVPAARRAPVYTGDVKEVNDYLKEREQLEKECRARIEDRVTKGTLTQQEADRILQTVFQ